MFGEPWNVAPDIRKDNPEGMPFFALPVVCPRRSHTFRMHLVKISANK